MCFFWWSRQLLLVSESTQGHLPPKGTERWVCEAAPYIPATGQQAERDWREVAAQRGSGDRRETGAGRPGVREDLDGGFPHRSRPGGKCIRQQAGEDGGWDVSHLASRSRWGWG